MSSARAVASPSRRRPPMVENDATVEVVGPDCPVKFLDLFQGRDELVVNKQREAAPPRPAPEGRHLPRRRRRPADETSNRIPPGQLHQRP
jgi:hypothetical protein